MNPSMADMIKLLHQHTQCRKCGKDVAPKEYVITHHNDDPLSPVCCGCIEEDRQRAKRTLFIVMSSITIIAIAIATLVL